MTTKDREKWFKLHHTLVKKNLSNWCAWYDQKVGLYNPKMV